MNKADRLIDRLYEEYLDRHSDNEKHKDLILTRNAIIKSVIAFMLVKIKTDLNKEDSKDG